MNYSSLMTFLSHLTDSSLVEILAVLVGSTVTGFALLFRSRLEWRRATFESRINISLNSIFGGILRIRTLCEDEVKNIILSPYARRLVKKAAKATTIEDPFLHFANKRDAWMVYNEVINAISSIYSSRILFTAMHGKSAKETKLYVAITWERDADIPIQKLRIILVKEIVLNEIGHKLDTIKVEVPDQRTRIDALIKMHEQIARGTWPTYQTVLLP